MKIIIYILPFLFLCCDQENQNISDTNKTLIEEAQIEKETNERSKKWATYEKNQLQYVGLTDPDSIILHGKDLLFQFKTIDLKTNNIEIIEIYDHLHSRAVTCKEVKYELDRNCHPDFGELEFTRQCLKIIYSNEYKIDTQHFASLLDYLKKIEFWGLKEHQSDYLDFITRGYRGKVFDYTAHYSLTYPTSNYLDTFVLKKHKVTRLPMDSEILTRIDLEVKNVLLKNK